MAAKSFSSTQSRLEKQPDLSFKINRLELILLFWGLGKNSQAGERKKARTFVKKGLLEPTENTLAQIFWAKENRHLNDAFKLDELVKSATDAYEADYQLNIINGNLLAALKAARTWEADEPFAARPCSEIAYVASLLDDHNLAIKMACRVKQLDGDIDPILNMNAICATLSSGKLRNGRDQAEIKKIQMKIIHSIEHADGSSYHAVANLGLWHYRYGDLSIGRECYMRAVAIAEKTHLTEAAAMAATYAAREAILSADPSANTILQQAKNLSLKSKNKASAFYLRKLDELILNPHKADEILSPASAGRFMRERKDNPKIRIEKTKNGVVLWVPKKKTS